MVTEYPLPDKNSDFYRKPLWKDIQIVIKGVPKEWSESRIFEAKLRLLCIEYDVDFKYKSKRRFFWSK